MNNTAALAPGVYYDPHALTALTTTCTTVTLQPGGVYWLDFPSTSTPWQISKSVIGPAPSACDGTNGVQLVFANQSKLNLAAQHQNDPTEPALLSIPCALSSTPDGPRIAIYGLNPAGTTVFRPTAAADTNGGLFTATANALPTATPGYPQDATQATATIPRRSTAELTLSSFAADPATPMPAGATIDSVVVSVAHSESERDHASSDDHMGLVQRHPVAGREYESDDLDLGEPTVEFRFLSRIPCIDDVADVASPDSEQRGDSRRARRRGADRDELDDGGRSRTQRLHRRRGRLLADRSGLEQRRDRDR